MKLKYRLTLGILVFILFLLASGIYFFLGIETRQAVGISFGSEQLDGVVAGSLLFLGIIVFLIILFTDALKKLRKLGKKYWYVFLVFDISKWIILLILAILYVKLGIGIQQSFVG